MGPLFSMFAWWVTGPAVAATCSGAPAWDCIVLDATSDFTVDRFATVSAAMDRTGFAVAVWEEYDLVAFAGVLKASRIQTNGSVLGWTIESTEDLWDLPDFNRSFLAVLSLPPTSPTATQFHVLARTNADGDYETANCDPSVLCPSSGTCALDLLELAVDAVSLVKISSTESLELSQDSGGCDTLPGVHFVEADLTDDIHSVWSRQGGNGAIALQDPHEDGWEQQDDMFGTWRDDDAGAPYDWLEANVSPRANEVDAEHHGAIVHAPGGGAYVIYDDWDYNPDEAVVTAWGVSGGWTQSGSELALNALGVRAIQVAGAFLDQDDDTYDQTVFAWVDGDTKVRVRRCDDTAANCVLGDTGWTPALGAVPLAGDEVLTKPVGQSITDVDIEWLRTRNGAGDDRPSLFVAVTVRDPNLGFARHVEVWAKTCMDLENTVDLSTGWVVATPWTVANLRQSYFGAAGQGNLDPQPDGNGIVVAAILEDLRDPDSFPTGGTTQIAVARRTVTCTN